MINKPLLQVSINFTSFSTEEDADYVRLYDGELGQTLLAELSGPAMPGAYSTTGNLLTLELETDSNAADNSNGTQAIVFFTRKSYYDDVINMDYIFAFRSGIIICSCMEMALIKGTINVDYDLYLQLEIFQYHLIMTQGKT